MEKVVLKATRRSVVGKQVKALRRAGELPAVLYGYKLEPLAISLNSHDTEMALRYTTASSLVTVEVDGTEYPTLIRERQRDAIKGIMIHLDFQAVSMTEKIRTNVGVQLHGTAPAVKELNAVLVTGLTELEVESFPQDLPERFTVDISSLANIGDGIYVRDLVLPDRVEMISSADEMLVLATLAKEEAVEEEVEKVAEELVEEGAEPDVIEKGKKEDEAGEGDG
ncbi:MAG: 50S ribosomal protein L25 [Anaerolineales bacterium]|nr:50S ribosomal protein L25 [Anaerolineales bacterium]